MKNEQGEPVLFEFKVTSATPEKQEDDALFRPPADYHEMHLPQF